MATQLLTTGFLLQTLNQRTAGLDKVLLSGLKLGHSHLAHSYLLKRELSPECVTCHWHLTINHVLVECIEYDIFRLILVDNNVALKDILIMCLQTTGLSTLCKSFIVLLFKYYCCLVSSGELCSSSLVLFGIYIYLYYLSDVSVGVFWQLPDYITFALFLHVSLYISVYFSNLSCL